MRKISTKSFFTNVHFLENQPVERPVFMKFLDSAGFFDINTNFIHRFTKKNNFKILMTDFFLSKLRILLMRHYYQHIRRSKWERAREFIFPIMIGLTAKIRK